MTAPLLEVSHLDVAYPVKGWRRPDFPALRDVSLAIETGETLGLVGESGSGKTTLGRAILGLAPVTAGDIAFQGAQIARLPRSARRALSKDIQVIFQDPYSSLNPAMTVSDILAEPLTAGGASRADAHRRVRELLDRVGLPADAARRLPREFSGGQRQRIAIARALARGPKLIVCDEVVSALDLTTQARVLDLLIELQENTGVAYLFISHDLSVVRHISHRVAVMLRGRIIEEGDAETVTSTPAEPYTQRLLLASPVADPVEQAARRAHYDSLPPIAAPKVVEK
ncbi:ABC transporter ATP-binding protein [Microbacterium saccharophilum]|uniref:ABC transporter ATP-binding protein n=1 Tax=Microbacterium saccharophilum TaxID=1213358 RepID=A0A5C8HWE8_9MICO|nr:ATP-binding cassette domain-containing protein [Microbacterium saccharophilum]TXK09192.1 ABC transporter ATP-binding protein [Microbacterium saccharophilum]GEP47626.1 ABC transporter ATP-binding protein [Microbacterium saccharophilum]